MTCYLHHLESVLKKAGINVTPENRKELDKVIHELVAVNYKNCSSSWRQVKQRLAEDEDDFILQLKTAWKNNA